VSYTDKTENGRNNQGYQQSDGDQDFNMVKIGQVFAHQAYGIGPGGKERSVPERQKPRVTQKQIEPQAHNREGQARLEQHKLIDWQHFRYEQQQDKEEKIDKKSGF
jgi:hypothetical protein